MTKVFLDLETTGTRTTRDRITEIAALKVEQDTVVGRFVQLVNPGQPIPSQIQRLTGITDAMVADAPSFAELAQELRDFLGDAELVAHNMRFDYGFLRNEFARNDMLFRARVLCTLKLSRRLAPEHPHHNLDALIKRHELIGHNRHRAEGDARALLALWQHWQQHVDKDHLATLLTEQRRMPSLPSQLDPGVLQDIPERPGVYLFFGHNRLPLYIGKSINLRARVLSHFHDDLTQDRKMRLTQQIQDLEWHETTGDLGAQLLEAQLIKAKLPIMNRRLRRQGKLMGWQWSPEQAAPRLVVGRSDHASHEGIPLYGLFRAAKEARQALKQIAEHHGLCPRLLGLEKGRGRCFSSQLGRCHGACHGAGVERQSRCSRSRGIGKTARAAMALAWSNRHWRGRNRQRCRGRFSLAPGRPLVLSRQRQGVGCHAHWQHSVSGLSVSTSTPTRYSAAPLTSTQVTTSVLAKDSSKQRRLRFTPSTPTVLVRTEKTDRVTR